MSKFLLALVFCLPLAAQAQQDIKAFVYGNSLINHVSETAETTMPYWLAQLADAGGRGFAMDGTFGFPRDFAARLPPTPDWSITGVDPVWDNDSLGFRRAGFNTIILNPENFVQYQGPEVAYPDDTASPLSTTLKVFDYTDGQVADARYFIYEGWAELGVFPPDPADIASYHTFNSGAYHDWYLAYVAGLSTADRPVTLIPVAPVLSRLFTETPLRDLGPEALYTDDAPHGTPTLYFLAAMITYASLYAEPPPAFTPPDTLPPAIRDTYPQIADFIWQAVSGAVSTGADQTDTPADTPALAMGLAGIADWSTQHPFIDLMKTARPWIGHLPGQWGGFEAEQFEAGDYLDPDGWLVKIPDGVERVETFILTDQPPAAVSLAGRYRLTYDGQGQIALGGLARDIDTRPGALWFSFTPGEGLVGISISATDPADPIRNIAVVKEELIDQFQAGAVFNPAWLRHVRDLRAVRFMDWMNTNGSPQVLWADRPLQTDYTFGRRGVPVEVMILLANEIGADPWFNMPHRADDAFVSAFATLVHDMLDPRLKAYVEYSNELWNFIFPQSIWAQDQARSRWGDDAGDDAWMQYAGLRAAQVADIWARVYAADPDRLVRVIATHTGWMGLEVPLLNAPLAQAEGASPPFGSFDAYAVTGYFGYDLGSDDIVGAVRDWLSGGDAPALAAAFIRDGSLDELLSETFPYHAAVAAEHGLDLIMYEGGTHVVGLGDNVNDQGLTDFFTTFNYSPDMAQLYAELLIGWRDSGGTLFNAFVDVSSPSKWGSWGALRHLDDINPRAATLMAYNAAGAAGDARAPDTFDQGAVFTGTLGNDLITGTPHEDVMIGLDGDDQFEVHGADHVNGGEGFDLAILPGLPTDTTLVWEGDRMVATGAGGRVTMFGIDGVGFSDLPGRLSMPEPTAP